MNLIKTYILAFISLMFAYNIYAAERVDVNLVIKDHKFIPEKIEAPSGAVLMIVIHNQDDVAEEFESHVLNREKLIPAGAKAKIVVGPLEPGEYEFFGEFYNPKGILIISSPSSGQ